MSYKPLQKEDFRNFRKIIGKNIYQLRLENKVTLKKLSYKTGISLIKLDQYEIGKSEITIHAAMKIANFFNVKPIDLLQEKKSKPSFLRRLIMKW